MKISAGVVKAEYIRLMITLSQKYCIMIIE